MSVALCADQTGRARAVRLRWERPCFNELSISDPSVAAAGPAAHVVERTAVDPQPPAEPALKLGFSFELAFPLSARTTDK